MIYQPVVWRWRLEKIETKLEEIYWTLIYLKVLRGIKGIMALFRSIRGIADQSALPRRPPSPQCTGATSSQSKAYLLDTKEIRLFPQRYMGRNGRYIASYGIT
jgi:hypothetical protein